MPRNADNSGSADGSPNIEKYQELMLRVLELMDRSEEAEESGDGDMSLIFLARASEVNEIA